MNAIERDLGTYGRFPVKIAHISGRDLFPSLVSVILKVCRSELVIGV